MPTESRYVRSRNRYTALAAAAAMASACATGTAWGYTFDTSPDWRVNLDATLQHTMGWRTESRNDKIGNHPFFAQGNYKFDRGDMVTNRTQTILEFQAIYQDRTGFRASGSAWNDFAYSDKVKTNPNPAFETFLSYPDGRYSDHTKRRHIRGAELLDGFVFYNFEAGDVPVYARFGRFTQQWGNAFFFGFSNNAYGQHSTDFIKAFSQPGSEVKELFLPRTQLNATALLTQELAVTAQYFLEYRANRFPEGGTYLGAFDILYEGPTSGGALAGALGGPVSAGNTFEPDHNNGNFGIKLDWAPQWANGDMSFMFRRMDETQPWSLGTINVDGGGSVNLHYADKVNLYGFSYETGIGSASMGFEVNYRTDTALSSAFFNGQPGVDYTEGARGDIVNVIANTFMSFGSTPLWDASSLIAEVSYTHLRKVTKNKELYLGDGRDACTDSLDPSKQGDKSDGCGTNNAVAVAAMYTPEWLGVFPSWDFSLPLYVQYGIYGNPAYAAGGFFAEGSMIRSIGLRADYQQRHEFVLQYQDFSWRTSPATDVPGLGTSYSGFGGNGPVALNDKGWVSLTYKTTF